MGADAREIEAQEATRTKMRSASRRKETRAVAPVPVMPKPPESPPRKQRDAALRTLDETIAEHLAQAWRTGEIQSAESYGKPLKEAEGWAQTPVEFRLPFKILKNADVVPPEVEMFHRRAALREALAACADEDSRRTLRQGLSELEQALALRLEGMRSSGRV